MAGPNAEPIFPKAADNQWVVSVTAANNTADLTSGTSYLVWTADATNGGILCELCVMVNPGNSTAATVVRFWQNNGSTLATASNTALFREIGMPATTTSATAPQPMGIISFGPDGYAFPLGYRIYATVGTAPGGSSAFSITGIGGKF